MWTYKVTNCCVTEVMTRSDTIVVTLVYRNIAACESIRTVNGFGIRIYERLAMLNTMWLSRATSMGGFCGTSACEDVVTVETVCGGAGSGRRRRQAGSDATVTITIPNVQ